MSELSAQLHNGIAKGSFVVFGRAGMDLYADPIGVKAEFGENFRADLGGSSANICVGLCKLGMKAALVTSLSDDTVGRFIRNKLIQYGVDVEHIRTLAGEYRSSLAVYESVMRIFRSASIATMQSIFRSRLRMLPILTMAALARLSPQARFSQRNLRAVPPLPLLIWPKRRVCRLYLILIIGPILGPRPKLQPMF